MHDSQKRADDSTLRPRIKSAKFASNAPATSTDKNLTRKLRKAEAELPTPVYDIKYDFIEKRAVSSVSMRSESAARKSSRLRLASKPSVARVLAEVSIHTYDTYDTCYSN